MIKDNLRVRTLEKRCLRRKESLGRYREERKQVVKRQKSTAHSQMIRSEGSAVHFEHDLSMIGPCAAISIKGNLKEGLG